MNIWYSIEIAGAVLALESVLNLVGKNDSKGNVVKLISGLATFLLAVFALHFSLWGAGIVVKSSMWYSISTAGAVLIFAGFFSFLVDKIGNRETSGDTIKTITGLVVFFVGFIMVLVTKS